MEVNMLAGNAPFLTAPSNLATVKHSKKFMIRSDEVLDATAD